MDEGRKDQLPLVRSRADAPGEQHPFIAKELDGCRSGARALEGREEEPYSTLNLRVRIHNYPVSSIVDEPHLSLLTSLTHPPLGPGE